MLFAEITDQLRKIAGQIRERIDLLESKKTIDKVQLGVLYTIENLLLESPDDFKMEHVKQALCYIELLPYKPRLSRALELFDIDTNYKKFSENLKYHDLPIIGDNAEYQKIKQQARVTPEKFYAPPTYLSTKTRLFLREIHQQLMPCCPKWNYSFREDLTGQIMNPTISDWQAECMDLASDKKAIVDLKRLVRILDDKGKLIDTLDENGEEKSDDAIVEMIERLVSRSDSSNSDKELLTQWLKNNGGQTNCMFVPFMLNACYFTDEKAFVSNMELIKINWYVKDDKICLDYDILLKNLAAIKDDASVPSMLSPSADNPFHALMRLNSRIELAVENDAAGDKKVIPKIKKIDVVSYTDQLKSPARLLENDYSARPAHR